MAQLSKLEGSSIIKNPYEDAAMSSTELNSSGDNNATFDINNNNLHHHYSYSTFDYTSSSSKDFVIPPPLSTSSTTSTTTTTTTTTTTSPLNQLNNISPPPSSPLLRDYEISKLPLRKRHLVPDSFYYNVHQHISISPQSPPTPKHCYSPVITTHTCTTSPKSSSIFSSYENDIVVKQEIDHMMEQRVPSPSHRDSPPQNKSTLAESSDSLNVDLLPRVLQRPQQPSVQQQNEDTMIDEDDVDVEAVDDDDMVGDFKHPEPYEPNLINETVPDRVLHHRNNNNFSFIDQNDLSNSSIYTTNDNDSDDNNDTNDNNTSCSHENNITKTETVIDESVNHHHHHHHTNTTISSPNSIKSTASSSDMTEEEMNDDDDQKSDVVIDSPVKLSTPPIAPPSPFELTKSNSQQNEDVEVDILVNEEDVQKCIISNNNLNHNNNHHTPKKSLKEEGENVTIRHNNTEKDIGIFDSGDETDSDSEIINIDERLYCICKRKYDSKTFMIACDKCDEWYHGECVNISEKDAKKIKSYVCIKCKRKEKEKEKVSSIPLHLINNNSNNNNNNNNHPNSPKLSPKVVQEKKKSSTTNISSPLLSPISPLELKLQSPIRETGNQTIHHHQPSPAKLKAPAPHREHHHHNHHNNNNNNNNNNHETPTKQQQSTSTSKPDLRKCAFSKCNGFASGSSKYCSKECGMANAKEILIKNPSLQKSILSSAAVAAASQLDPSTQKLLSSSNSEDANKLHLLSEKRSEVESKLKKLEKKISEFEKSVQLTKLKFESNSIFVESCKLNGGAAGGESKLYTTSSSSSSPSTSSPSSTQLCIFPIKESTNGICGQHQCTKHLGWEKKRRELFLKEQNFHTKTLRDISLEEKQIHQRIARRNKIQQQTSNNAPSNNTSFSVEV
eukprot:gene5543-6902_t